MTKDSPQAVQPDQEYVIAALMEDNNALQQNKLYLIAVIKQMQAEFAFEREMWGLEKESLLLGREDSANNLEAS